MTCSSQTSFIVEALNFQQRLSTIGFDVNFTGTNKLIFGNSPDQTKVYQGNQFFKIMLPSSDGSHYFRLTNPADEYIFSISSAGVVQAENDLTFIDPFVLADYLYFNTNKTAFMYGTGNAVVLKTTYSSSSIFVALEGDWNGDSAFELINGNNKIPFRVDSTGRIEAINNKYAPKGILDVADFSGQGIQPVSLTSIGTTATLVTEYPHNRETGTNVTIVGADQSQYNGTFSITKIDDTSFSYTMSGVPTASPATGTIYYLVKGIIGAVHHHYKEGHVIQLDYVGDGGYAILKLQNANNSIRRPDKPADFWGKGNYIECGDENGTFYKWFGTNREQGWLQGTWSMTSYVTAADPAFENRAYYANTILHRWRSPSGYLLNLGEIDNGGNPATHFQGLLTGGIKLDAVNGDLILEADNYLILNNLPTSPSGLPTGAVYSDSGVLRVA